jgi:alanyl-tRNA synthetase
LIHWALRKVLGTHVRQAGTSKTAERMRFDFSHFEAATPEQLREIENLINAKVIENARVETYETEFDKKPADTLAFFGDKYGKHRPRGRHRRLQPRALRRHPRRHHG